MITLRVERGGKDYKMAAAYLKVSSERVAKTIALDSQKNIMADLDAAGRLVGIEILGPAKIRIEGVIGQIRTRFPPTELPEEALKELENELVAA
jgi:uncharacterized protein YuzE